MLRRRRGGFLSVLDFPAIFSRPAVAQAGGAVAAGYTPQGVHFDGATWLLNSGLVSTDGGTVIFSVTFRVDAGSPVFWVCDPEDTNLNGFYFGGEGDIYSFFGDGAGNQIFSDNFNFDNSVWYNFIGSADVRRDTPVLCGYLNDILVGQPPIVNGIFGGLSDIKFNGLPLWVGNATGDFMVGDMVCLRIWTAKSALDDGGDIPEATRRLFFDVDGNVVAPAVANAEFGTPAVWLDADPGDAASFATNRGTGGAFDLTGALTLAA